MRHEIRRRLSTASLAASSVVACALACATPVAARGGGGGHSGGGGNGGGGNGGGGFSGGHGGGGYEGGYSGDAGSSFGDLGTLYVVLFVLLSTLVIIGLVLYAVKPDWCWNYARMLLRLARGSADEETPKQKPERIDSSRSARGRMAADHPVDRADKNIVAGLAAIAAADPDFDLETFLQRAEMTYFLIQRAYRIRKADEARAYMLASLHATWSAQIAAMVAARRRPVLENLNVRGMYVGAVRREAGMVDVTVHYNVVAADRVVDEITGKILTGTTEDRRFGARFTFSRAFDAKTRADGGVTSSKCPSCGAPLALDGGTLCTHCRADVASGVGDWVVSKMSDAPYVETDAYALLDAHPVPAADGFRAILAQDAAFSEARFLARARSAFGALEKAWTTRDLEGARPYASPGLYLAWRTQLEQLTDEGRVNVLEGLEIDIVDPLHVIHGKTFDDVVVRFTAHCADYEIDATTKRIVFGDTHVRPFREIWTFQRAIGTQSVERGLVEMHCPNCGAPLEMTQIGECRYCRAAVTSGKFDWVVSRIEQEANA